ncbi:hypothetical protein [[Clostridium] symbiosum]|jgi:hypothetical protein|nr:hypothetical protein [[Clostridium] symbiosum]
MAYVFLKCRKKIFKKPSSFFILSGGLEALGAEYGILEKQDASAPPM